MIQRQLSDSSTLVDELLLEESTDPEVIRYTYLQNSEAWKYRLSTEDYVKREMYLREESMMLNNKTEPLMGIHLYVLRRSSEYSKTSSKTDNIVASLEVLIRKAWRVDGSNKENAYMVNCATVGNVFTLKNHRGQGYASELMNRLNVILDEKLGPGGFSNLYSEVGSFYSKFGFQDRLVKVNYIPSDFNLVKLNVHKFSFLRLKSYDEHVELDSSNTLNDLLARAEHLGKNDVAVSLIPKPEIFHQINLKDQFIHNALYPKSTKKVENFGVKFQNTNDHILWNHDWNQRLLVITKVFIEDEENSDAYIDKFLELVSLACVEARAHELANVSIWSTSMAKTQEVHFKLVKVLSEFFHHFDYKFSDMSLISHGAIRINDQLAAENSQNNKIEWVQNEKWCWY
ncbi:hypothetical protein BN7_1686 [Wickerhamomyces ciferrii]|uniref:Uncharacterized protein n=1 Tax=Wickerhamomyces ciferrii (strain ATCC 14091 / BCRC 22168 / CBS 111 / JCM 3599 / NBRC 0793 / NRRL Y-1031 F-60-10) TaxID=1206466 RepID=K0KGN4_WICCF|nr:uncharacterized protein BN7_1686 [Wickerhamomyces ciferrii]CCH42141.1 hypothetical protein BN7_1686 [Wickerhamomyces ciferrii]